MSWWRGFWRGAQIMIALTVFPGVMIETLFARDRPWRGEWLWTFDWMAGGVVLLGPVVAGLSAFEVARWRRFRGQYVSVSVWQQSLCRVVPCAPILTCAIASLVLSTGAATAMTAVSAEYPAGSAPAILLAGVLQLIFAAAIGVAIGEHLVPIVAAGLAAIAFYAVAVASNRLGLPGALVIGGQTGTLSGSELSVQALFAAFPVFAGLALLLVGSARLHRSRRFPASLSVVAGGAALVIAGCLVASRPTARSLYTPVPAAQQRFRCAGDVVQTCLAVENSAQLTSWAELMDRAAAHLRSKGLPVRATYRQVLPWRAVDPPDGVLAPDPQTVNILPARPLDAGKAMARPIDCPAFSDSTWTEDLSKGLSARRWLAEWIALEVFGEGRAEQDPSVADWARSTARPGQYAWALSTLTSLAACDLREVGLPPGVSG